MYATIRTYAGSQGMADALVENESEVRQIITGIDGFRAYYLIKTADGAVSISVRRRGRLRGVDGGGGSDVRENLPDYAGSPPQVSSGEVLVTL